MLEETHLVVFGSGDVRLRPLGDSLERQCQGESTRSEKAGDALLFLPNGHDWEMVLVVLVLIYVNTFFF